MGLLDNDPTVVHRSALLPFLRRSRVDGPEGMQTFQGELAVPGVLYDAFMNMGRSGQMLMGERPFDEGLLTQTMLDAPFTGGLLAGAAGMVPKGAVLGANVGGRISPGIKAEYARQGRMQPAEAPTGARGQELGVPTPYSKYIKPSQAELDQMEAGLLRATAPDMGERKILNLADIEGQKIFPLVGDRTSREIISQVGGQKLNQPITTQGGYGYSMSDDTGGWASHPNIITRLRNEITKQGGGIGVAMPMAGTGSDYSTHSIEVMYGLNLPEQMTKRALQTIKKLVNKRIKIKNASLEPENRIKKFPGLDDPDSYNYFMRNPDVRKFFMEEIDKKEIRNIPTMPDSILLRQAVTDASLKDMRRGDTDALAGQSFVSFTPDAQMQPVSLLPSPHKTYGVDLSGEYLGGLPHAVPRSLLLPDFVTQKLAEGYTPATINYLLPRDMPFQTVTPQMVDNVGMYIENLIRQGGK